MSSTASPPQGLAHGGGHLRFWRCADERAEAAAIAGEIERLIFREQVPPGAIAVLSPAMDSSAQAVALALQERAIPHRVEGALGALPSRPEVRDAIAWMRLLLDQGDAAAAARALLRPPVEMRHVDLAQVVQIARRRRLPIVAALPDAVESPQVSPQARERIRRFLEIHRVLAAALTEMGPQRFMGHLLRQLGLRRGSPLAGDSELADRSASLDRLEQIAASFERRTPWADAREMAAHLAADPAGARGALALGAGQRPAVLDGEWERAAQAPALALVPDPASGQAAVPASPAPASAVSASSVAAPAEVTLTAAPAPPAPAPAPAPAPTPPGAVCLSTLSHGAAMATAQRPWAWEHAFLAGLHAAGVQPAADAAAAADDVTAEPALDLERLAEALASRCTEVVLSYPAQADGRPQAEPAPALERLRTALGASWEDGSRRQADTEEMIESALRTMRQELMEGVASIGGRLGELRLDTEIDISHGVVRYLELVKLAALLERAPGQSIADALADVNSRLASAVTPLQREILESSTLDEELLGGGGGGAGGAAGAGVAAARGGGGPPLRRTGSAEPSLQRFLPRKGDGLLLSASDVEMYVSCPLRYKLARVLRIPTETTRSQRFGIALHQVLERYHASGARTLQQLLELLETCWRRSGLGDGEKERVLREKAVAALRSYHRRLAEQEAQPLWLERSFAFHIGRHHVRGRVDRVDRLPDGGHELIDYKTGRPKSEEQLRQDIQLPLYALAARECWQLESAPRASYLHLLDDVKVPLPAASADPDRVRETVLEVGEAIALERFDPTPSKQACAICDYRIVCPVAEV